jgi:uncharacterized protein (TIGR03084 family)
MPVDYQRLVADLAAETDDLVAILERGDPGANVFDRPTPADGWSVGDQVRHLTYFDDALVRAVTDPDAFRDEVAEAIAAGPGYADRLTSSLRTLSTEATLPSFASARSRLLTELRAHDQKERVPWYGPDMSLTSAATARLMETWAHGQDVADALGARRTATARLRHIADLGVRTLSFSYVIHGLEPPSEPVRVELTAPGGDLWSFGPEGSENLVSGTAEDFCLVVTQRRPLATTALVTKGAIASQWIAIAQAFAGGPTTTPPDRMANE